MGYLLRNAASAKRARQSEPIPGRERDMHKNNAGGFAFKADSFTQLERFLILGAEGNTYYCAERDMVKQNVDNVRACIATDGLRAVKNIVDISTAGRAPKNDPALYALALAASYGPDIKVREAALASLPKVARIGTQLFQFCTYISTMRGWGPALRRAIANWYLEKPIDALAYQMVKYQQREGVSHRDLLRLAHPKGSNDALFRWALGAGYERRESHRDSKGAYYGPTRVYSSTEDQVLPQIIAAFEAAKTADESAVIKLIRDAGLTREMVPTEHQKSPKVWEALLDKMPPTAMIRSLGRMGACGLLAPLSDAVALVTARLHNRDLLRNKRVHPIQILSAMLTYGQGKGVKGSLTWNPLPQIIDALDDAFYAAFESVVPTGKRFYLGIDVSGSMDGGTIAGVPGLTPRMGAAAMAMLTVRTEPNWYAAGFSDGSRTNNAIKGTTRWAYGNGSRYVPAMERLALGSNQRLDAVMKMMADVPMGGTDCALPMLDAAAQRIPVDCFIIITDNETWAGKIHPKQALDEYRNKMGIDAKCIVCGMTATSLTIADPKDGGMIDIVGFDTAVPQLISWFVGGDSGSMDEQE